MTYSGCYARKLSQMLFSTNRLYTLIFKNLMDIYQAKLPMLDLLIYKDVFIPCQKAFFSTYYKVNN